MTQSRTSFSWLIIVVLYQHMPFITHTHVYLGEGNNCDMGRIGALEVNGKETTLEKCLLCASFAMACSCFCPCGCTVWQSSTIEAWGRVEQEPSVESNRPGSATHSCWFQVYYITTLYSFPLLLYKKQFLVYKIVWRTKTINFKHLAHAQ